MSTLHERLIAATAQPLAGMNYSTGFLKAKVDALRAVVELHTPQPIAYENRLGCTGCNSDCDFGEQDWPCSTITTIAEALGVEIGETP